MRFSALLNAVKDARKDYSRITIPQDDVVMYCDSLTRMIKENYVPDIIVAIETGGVVPGELIAKLFSVPVLYIGIRRNIFIRQYSFNLRPIQWIMSVYHHFLFHAMKPVLNKEIAMDISNKKILVVDDVLHTGATFDVAIEYLKRKGAIKIRTVSLSYVSKRKPDYSILPAGDYSFPWSKDFNSRKIK